MGRWQRRGRPAVLDAARTAAIPLRPLTLVEILDAGFVVLRRRPQAMLGLPVAVAAAIALLSVGVVLMARVLGELTSMVAQVLIAVGGILGASVVVVVALVWVSAVLTRVGLEVLVGPGFAPVRRRLDLKLMVRMLPSIVGLSILQYLAVMVLQSGVGVMSFLMIPAVAIPDPMLQQIAVLVIAALMTIISCWLYAYVALAVPAYMAENVRTPAWIGKPHRATGVASALTRSFGLVGFRGSQRPALVLAGTGLVCGVVNYLASQGVILLAFTIAFNLSPALFFAMMSSGVLILMVLGAQVIGLCVSIAYVAAVQAVLYLDLRMRREGLDLALRFDAVAVPQPVPPPFSPAPFSPPPFSPAPVQQPRDQ